MKPIIYSPDTSPDTLTKQERRELMDLLEDTMNEERPCYNPACGILTTSNSHVLQKKGGILESIAVKGSVVERSPGTPFQPRQFIGKGIQKSDVLAFVGFCNDKNGGISCDRDIFNEIENNTPDFNNYRHNLLFAYRAHLCLMHKGRAWTDAYQKLAERYPDSYTINELKNIRNRKQELTAIQQDHIKYLFEKEVYCGKNVVAENFEFTHVELPIYVELAACSTFALPIRHSLHKTGDEILALNPQSDKLRGFPPFSYYAAIIPVKGKSHLIIGHQKGIKYLEGIKIKKLPTMNKAQVYTFINKLLMKRFDTWCISTSFYENLTKYYTPDYLATKMDDYRHIYTNQALDKMQLPINFFKGVVNVTL